MARPPQRRSVLPDIISVLVFVLMLRLGMWQLDRAEQKEARHAQYVANRAAPACGDDACLTDLVVDTARLGHPVRLQAPKWLPQRFILENQTHEGRAGYFLIEALDTQPITLVQRAWIPAPEDRSSVPALPMDARSEALALVGEVAWPPATGVLFTAPLPAEPMGEALFRIQSLEPSVLDSLLPRALAPMVLRELASQPDGLLRPWREPKSGADKHRAYAVQWFAMSAVLVLVHWNFRRRSNHGTH